MRTLGDGGSTVIEVNFALRKFSRLATMPQFLNRQYGEDSDRFNKVINFLAFVIKANRQLEFQPLLLILVKAKFSHFHYLKNWD